MQDLFGWTLDWVQNLDTHEYDLTVTNNTGMGGEGLEFITVPSSGVGFRHKIVITRIDMGETRVIASTPSATFEGWDGDYVFVVYGGHIVNKRFVGGNNQNSWMRGVLDCGGQNSIYADPA